jgi:hypothetical protein
MLIAHTAAKNSLMKWLNFENPSLWPWFGPLQNYVQLFGFDLLDFEEQNRAEGIWVWLLVSHKLQWELRYWIQRGCPPPFFDKFWCQGLSFCFISNKKLSLIRILLMETTQKEEFDEGTSQEKIVEEIRTNDKGKKVKVNLLHSKIRWSKPSKSFLLKKKWILPWRPERYISSLQVLKHQKKWKKFGQSSGTPPGPEKGTTSVEEDVYLDLNLASINVRCDTSLIFY